MPLPVAPAFDPAVAVALVPSLSEASAQVAGLLERYGYLALFLVFLLEGAMLLYFAPSESLVPFAVVAIADDPAEYPLVIAVAVVGATIGQYALFRVSRDVGRERLVESRWLRISEAHLSRFERWFDRWGPLAIPLSNTLLFTRGMLTIPAGIGGMDDRRFVAYSALGTVVFEVGLALLTLGALEALA